MVHEHEHMNVIQHLQARMKRACVVHECMGTCMRRRMRRACTHARDMRACGKSAGRLTWGIGAQQRSRRQQILRMGEGPQGRAVCMCVLAEKLRLTKAGLVRSQNVEV